MDQPSGGRPGPGARVVSRPSLLALVMWPYITLIAVALLALGGTGARITGALLALLCLFGLARMLRARVWVDGDRLLSRGIARYGPPLRLDRLRSAHLTSFGRNRGRQLHLRDADGTRLILDATNTSLRRLWPVLAHHVRWDSGVANAVLRKRLVKHWPGPPLGPGE